MANRVNQMATMGWTQSGAKVWVEHIWDNGECLVRPVLHGIQYDVDGNDREVLGELSIVSAVWDAAPVEVYNTEIATKKAELEKLQEWCVNAAAEKHGWENKIAEKKRQYAAIPELRQLDQFIAGKITHYVHVQKWYSPRITAFSEEVSEYTDNERGLGKMRLLSLYGKSNGNLEWNLNQWNEGSGSNYTVFPCCSLEEAKAVLQVEFDKRFVDSASASLLKDAEAAAVQVPDDFRQRVRDEQIKQARKTVDELSVKVIEANKKLLEVQGD